MKTLQRIRFETAAALVLIALFWLSPTIAGAEAPAETLEVIGRSGVYKDNIVAARENAIRNGLVTAIERSVAGQIPVESMIQHFQNLSEVLFEQTEDFILGYKVLTEARSGNTYRVIVKADIAMERIRTALTEAGIMLGGKPMPRIFFVVTETGLHDSEAGYWWGEDAVQKRATAEVAMAKVLREKGLILIEPATVTEEIRYTALACAPDFDPKEVVDLGLRLQADVVVFGKSRAAPAANTMGGEVRSFSGIVALQAFRIDTGQSIAEIRETSVAAHADEVVGSREALAAAGALAGDLLAGKIIEDWKAEKAAEPIEILVTGTARLANFVMFRRMLGGLPGVRELQTRERKPDSAILLVDYEGSEKELADALLVKTFDTFGIQINEVVPNRIRIDLLAN